MAKRTALLKRLYDMNALPEKEMGLLRKLEGMGALDAGLNKLSQNEQFITSLKSQSKPVEAKPEITEQISPKPQEQIPSMEEYAYTPTGMSPLQQMPAELAKAGYGAIKRGGQAAYEAITQPGTTEKGLSTLQQLPGTIAKGVGETGLTLASGAVAMPASGLIGIGAGLAEAAGFDVDTTNVIKKVQEALTYKARTPEAQKLQSEIGKLLQPIGEGMKYSEKALGEKGYEIAGPVGGAIGATLPTAIIEIASGAKGIKNIRARKAAVRETLEQTAKEEIFDANGAVKQEVKQALSDAELNADDLIKDKDLYKGIDEDKSLYVARLSKKAASDDIGAGAAKRKLAEIADIDPDTLSAAQRLEMDFLPVDIHSKEPLVRQSAAIPRMEVGSVPEADFRAKTMQAAEHADELMTRIDATPNIADVSETVKNKLMGQQKKLQDMGEKFYAEVNADVPKNTTMQTDNLKAYLDQTLDDLGGDKTGFTSREKYLYNMLTGKDKKPVTYFRLLREKNKIGEAIAGKDNIYSQSMDQASLKQLYGALALDQKATVASIKPELLGRLEAANRIWKKKKDLEDTIVLGYGKNGEGSIANLLKTAMKGGKEGDVKNLNKVLSVIPKPLQKRALGTALMATTRSKSGQSIVKGGFGFSEYVDMYKGLRNNKPVYKKIIDVIGHENHQFLNDIYKVSKRLTDARAVIYQTGKANQVLQAEMLRTVNGMMDKFIGTAGGTAAKMAGRAVMAPRIGDAIASTLKAAQAPDPRIAVGKLFSSPEFQNMMTTIVKKEAVGEKVPYSVFKRVLHSKAFNKFANAARIGKDFKSKEAWLMQQYNLSKEQAKEGEEQ